MLIADHRFPDGADGTNPGQHGLGASTRDRIRQIIAEHGPLTAAALASHLGLTPTAAGEDVTARAEALATALTADGFAASTGPVGDVTALAGVQLRQGHCPVQHVAAQFPAFCDAETDAFSRLLGVHVERLGTLAHGEHVCTTFIPMSAVPMKTLSGTTTSNEGFT